MTKIRGECRENAIGMLQSRPEFFIGERQFANGDIGRYYIVDGKLWGAYSGGEVRRCDCPEEQAATLRVLKSSSKWKARAQ